MLHSLKRIDSIFPLTATTTTTTKSRKWNRDEKRAREREGERKREWKRESVWDLLTIFPIFFHFLCITSAYCQSATIVTLCVSFCGCCCCCFFKWLLCSAPEQPRLHEYQASRFSVYMRESLGFFSILFFSLSISHYNSMQFFVFLIRLADRADLNCRDISFIHFAAHNNINKNITIS